MDGGDRPAGRHLVPVGELILDHHPTVGERRKHRPNALPELLASERPAGRVVPDEIAGEELFFGKAGCAACHPAPFYLDDKMHDLRLEEFLNEPGDGPIKTFTLRGIKDSPPYMHDGRCLTLEDTVEFFNIVLTLQLTQQEKQDLVAFMRALKVILSEAKNLALRWMVR